MPSSLVLGRYRIDEPPIGQGGMGIVYKAFDSLTKRFVALKTIRGDVDPACIEMFQKEWMQLAQLSHPNIVDVLDIGDVVENGQHRPYFVMPLLQGSTLDGLIKSSGARLTPERTVEIFSQTCRGLQAAHDRGFVHRDLKPSNLFVMNDDTVKIIDFGIVHLVDTQSRTGVKGTLQYMSPEQLEMKPANSRSDIFSLGVVCYEALTGRKPFERGTMEEIVEAIRTYIPPPVSELNPSVNEQVSRAIQKAMAKQPYHRFASAREFSEILQRSLRNEHIEIFDRGRIQPRINRIKKALTDGDYQLATDMLDELESEGNLDPEISVLRVKTEQAARSRVIYQLIESGRTRMEEQEFPLALQNVQRVLDLDPTNIDALAMRAEIERQRSTSQVEKWLQIARQHLDSRLFEKARQALDEVRKVDHANPEARDLLAAISEGEQETAQLRQEKQQLYDAALQGYRNGELSSALSKLQKVLDLGKRAPGHPSTDAQYLALYEQIRSEHDELHNAYSEGKKALELHNFARALDICHEILHRRPGEPLFQALKIQIDDLQRQESSAKIAELHRQVEAELDLERKFSIVTQAIRDFPDEKLFSQSLKVVKERRDLVNSIVARARQYESQRLFMEASNQWDVIRNIYPQFPGIEYELQRLARKQEEYGKEEAKAAWIDKIDRALFIRDFRRANDFLQSALLEYADDAELLRLKDQIEQAAKTSSDAQALLEEGELLARSGDNLEAIKKLRLARVLDDSNPSIRGVLRAVLVEHAQTLVEQDWRSAVPFVEEALGIDSSDPGAASVSRLIEDMRQREQIEGILAQARELQASRKLEEALEKVEDGLREYPNEIRLSQLRNTLHAAVEMQAPKTDASLKDASLKTDKSDASPQVDGTSNALSATRFFSVGEANINELEGRLSTEASDVGPKLVARPTIKNEEAEEHRAGFGSRTKILTAVAALVLISAAVWFQLGRAGKSEPKGDLPASDAVHQEPASSSVPQASPPDAAQRTHTPMIPAKVNQEVAVPPPAGIAKLTTISFNSDPPGASVKVDDESSLTCETPCELPLRRGLHQVVFSKRGYEPIQRPVQVPEDANSNQFLRPLMQTVQVISTPPGVALTVDGEPRGATPVTLRLQPGSHTLRLTQAGASSEKVVEVTPDTLIISLSLARQSDVPAATSGPPPAR